MNSFIHFIYNPNKIADLEMKLQQEINKNNILQKDNLQLKESIKYNCDTAPPAPGCIDNKAIMDINHLQQELFNNKTEKEKLKVELLKATKVINDMKNDIRISNNNSKRLEEENINLKRQLILKENEIKNKTQNNIIEKPKFNLNDIIVITFISKDSDVQYGIKCLANETFAEVEEKLYKKYEKLRESNNMFTVNGKKILRFKKIAENDIKDGDTILLFKLE